MSKKIDGYKTDWKTERQKAERQNVVGEGLILFIMPPPPYFRVEWGWGCEGGLIWDKMLIRSGGVYVVGRGWELRGIVVYW